MKRHTDPPSEPDIQQRFPGAEREALEGLVKLKVRLRSCGPESRWKMLLQGLVNLTGSQYAFISKQALDLPEDLEGSISQRGCESLQLRILHSLFDDGVALRYAQTNVTYSGVYCSCAELGCAKAFLIPHGFGQFCPKDMVASASITPPDAYMGIPIFDGSQCFAHFALMWSNVGASSRRLSWAFIELLCHAVEDYITKYLVVDSDALEPEPCTTEPLDRVIPTMVQSANQMFARHAETLSHELRTPMQGIVGTLDVMRMTLERGKEARGGCSNLNVLELIDDDLDAAQESASRAIEAADNIVKAYELNLGFPDSSMMDEIVTRPKSSSDLLSTSISSNAQEMVRTGSLNSHQLKRRRSTSYGDSFRVKMRGSTGTLRARSSAENSCSRSQRGSSRPFGSGVDPSTPIIAYHSKTLSNSGILNGFGHGPQVTNIRELIKQVVYEGIKIGSKVVVSILSSSENGESLKVDMITNNGSTSSNTVSWSVDSSTPKFLFVDERSLGKAISCIFRNSVKFTNKGQISIDVSFTESDRVLHINFKDTGPGISTNFQSEIFEPFSREHEGTTRHTEGLGLGLMIAKGLACKLGGDLSLVSADTSGLNRGTEFAMHIPTSMNPFTAGLSTMSISEQGLQFHRMEDTRDIPTIIRRDLAASPAPGDLDFSQTSQYLPTPDLSYSSTSSCKTSLSPNDPTWLSSLDITLPADVVAEVISPDSVTGIFSNPFTTHINNLDDVAICDVPSPETSLRRTLSAAPSIRERFTLATEYPFNFLVVEDNAVNRRLLVNMLSKLGYDAQNMVREAKDGQDAVDQVRQSLSNSNSNSNSDACETTLYRTDIDTHTQSPSQSQPQPQSISRPIDIILMDLWMPNKDGYEASAEILRLFSSYPHHQLTPPTIIAITADATDGAAEKALRAGMQGVLQKPFRIKDLERLVKQVGLGRLGQ